MGGAAQKAKVGAPGAISPEPHPNFIEVFCEIAVGDCDRQVARAGRMGQPTRPGERDCAGRGSSETFDSHSSKTVTQIDGGDTGSSVPRRGNR